MIEFKIINDFRQITSEVLTQNHPLGMNHSPGMNLEPGYVTLRLIGKYPDINKTVFRTNL